MEHKHIFADGTFYIAPPNTCQVFITRTYITGLNGFYTTSISILKNKEQATYEVLFDEIKKKMLLNIIRILVFLIKLKIHVKGINLPVANS